MVDRALIVKALEGMVDPHTGKELFSGGFIQDLRIQDRNVSFQMRPPEGEDHCPRYVEFAVEVKRRILKVKGVGKVSARLICHIQAKAVNQALEMMDDMEGQI